MKTTFTWLVALLLISNTIFAQQDLKSPSGYLQTLGNEFKAIQSATWDYTKSAANNKSARKINKRRLELVQQIDASLKNVSKLPAFNGKTYLKDSILSFLRIQKIVINEDYAKIMDLEDVAESSYDAMEAYFKAREIASQKVEKSSENVNNTYTAFAKENEVTIIEGDQDKITKQLQIADEVYGYYNPIYLIFFKSYKQEAYLLDALNKGDIAALEQNKSSLATISNECLAKLKTLKSFRGTDNSLLNAAIEIIKFHKMESETKFAKIIEFQAKNEAFNKSKKAFEANKNKTNEDINAYNKQIEEFNKILNEYNALNNELYKTRSGLINDWNKSSQNFTAKYL